jgi:RibD C-terminal domain
MVSGSFGVRLRDASGHLSPFVGAHFGEGVTLATNVLRNRYPIVMQGGMHIADVRDVAAVLAAVMEPGRGPRGYMVSGHYISLPDLIGTLGELSGRRIRFLVFPRRFLAVFGSAADVAQRRLKTRLPWQGEGIWVMNCAARCDDSKTHVSHPGRRDAGPGRTRGGPDRRLRKEEEEPEIQVHGSSGLFQSLLAHGLVDELRLWTFPVVLGTGTRLFGEGTVPAGLELLDSATSTTGVVMATYRTGAAIRYGSFEFEEPSEAEIKRREALAKEN